MDPTADELLTTAVKGDNSDEWFEKMERRKRARSESWMAVMSGCVWYECSPDAWHLQRKPLKPPARPSRLRAKRSPQARHRMGVLLWGWVWGV